MKFAGILAGVTGSGSGARVVVRREDAWSSLTATLPAPEVCATQPAGAAKWCSVIQPPRGTAPAKPCFPNGAGGALHPANRPTVR